jgi:hypothetical protein
MTRFAFTPFLRSTLLASRIDSSWKLLMTCGAEVTAEDAIAAPVLQSDSRDRCLEQRVREESRETGTFATFQATRSDFQVLKRRTTPLVDHLLAERVSSSNDSSAVTSAGKRFLTTQTPCVQSAKIAFSLAALVMRRKMSPVASETETEEGPYFR